MTVKSLALVINAAFVVAVALPSSSSAQISQTPLISPPVSSQPPTGTATGTTDRQGQTNRPHRAAPSTPRQVPGGWHLPLPRIHKR